MRKGKIFSGTSHPRLTEAICERLGIRASAAELGKFSNGETSVNLGVSIRDQEIFIVQTGGKRIMELLVMIQACKGGSASKIYAILPYFPYSRQSKKKAHRGGITARMLANLLTISGVNHVVTIDLHASQMQGFFTVPVDNLRAEPLFTKWIKQNLPNYKKDAVVVSKNPGGTKRVTSLADSLQISFGIVTTERIRNLSAMNSSLLWERPEAREPDSPETTIGDKEPPVTPKNSHSRTTSAASNLSIDSNPTRRPSLSRARTSPLPLVDREEDYNDQRAEFITGRLVHGRIVDDNYPSPAMSMNGSVATLPLSPFISHSDPDPMANSMISTTSSIADFALRGQQYHEEEESDEEEEQLKNPINELKITLVGDVRGKTVFILDDIIDQAGSWIAAAECVVKRGGAKVVYCMATHGLFGDNALQELQECECIDYIVVTNSLPIETTDRITKLRVIDTSSLLAEAMRRNHYGESLSLLYNNFTI